MHDGTKGGQMARDRFMFFPNFKATADKLDDKTRLAFYDAITNYVFNDLEPQDPIVSALLEAIKPSLDKVDGRQNNGGNHNPNGVNQHSKVGQSGQIRSKLVNSGQFLSETETEEETETETEVKEKEISNDISKKKNNQIDYQNEKSKSKFNEESIIYVNGQYFDEFPPESVPLLKKHWSLEELEDIRKRMAFKPEHQTTVAQMLVEYPPKPKKKPYGEQQKVKLTDEEYEKLQDLYGRRLDNAIDLLDGYIARQKKDPYASHYAVMRRNNWVYEKTFATDFVPLKPQIADMSKFVRAKPLGEEND